MEMSGLAKILRLQDFSRWTKPDQPSRQEKRLGKMLLHELVIVKYGHNGAPLRNPCLDQHQQVDHRPLVDGIEGLIEQNELRILQHGPGKKGTLHLPTREGVDISPFKTGESDRFQRAVDRRPIFGTVSSEQAASRPETEGHKVSYLGWKRPVQLRLLRQIGDGDRRTDPTFAAKRLQNAGNAFHQRGFSRAVGADNGGKRAAGNTTIEMVHRRPAGISKGQI